MENKVKNIQLSDDKRRTVWEEMKKALRNADAMKECGRLLEAVICYQTREYKLHLAEGLKWDECRQQLNFSTGTMNRYIAAAKFVEEWAVKKYPVHDGEPLIITEKMVTEFVRERRGSGLGTDIKSLGEERRKNLLLLRHLDGENVLDNAEFKLAMKVEAPPDAPENIIPSPRVEENLFSMHERITSAGYEWQKETGKYLNPDRSEMTSDQLSEFVDDATGLKIFEETLDILEPARKALVLKIDQFKIFYLAYSKKHSSPKFQELIEEKYKAVESEALGMLHEVGMMLKDDEE